MNHLTVSKVTGPKFTISAWHFPPPPDPSTNSTRYVGLLSKKEDFYTILLFTCGMSDHAIRRHTGLSPGQIHYRIRKAKAKLERAGLTRKHFRLGTSPLSAVAANAVMQAFSQNIVEHLRQLPEGRKTKVIDV